MNSDKVVNQLRKWAKFNDVVRAVVLTSSRSDNTNATVDQFSDYDVVVYVNSLDDFRNDDWLPFFGKILVKWPLKPESEFGENWLTRLVIFENRTRIDFQITTDTHTPPFDYDLGYLVIIDKDGFTKNFPKATKTKHLIQKPTQQEFLEMVNAFFWDATYIPKYLYREDLFYTNYMFEVDLRFSHFEKMIEWYIGSQHNWTVNTNVHGRLFPKYLDNVTWNNIKETFAGANTKDVWNAFFKLVKVFTSLARVVAEKCEYPYPKAQEKKMLHYFQKSKEMFDNKTSL
ncbi:aminoglycoside 6-adenylyltransferase [Candidatus Beckwithbacteria bacterium]|nr:aminoglycoside 6-adenylyltransferase [Candidatus Beckwithbacteria bacterium]